MIWDLLDDSLILAVLLVTLPLILGGLISPLVSSRKGRMRTEREEHYDRADINEVFWLFDERLKFEGFRTEPDESQYRIEATRTRWNLISGAHRDLPLKALIESERGTSGVTVHISMWTTDLVLMDSGEGRHIDELLNRLLHADLDKDVAIVVSGPSFFAMEAIWIAATCSVATALLFYPGYEIPQLQEVFEGLLAGNIVAFIIAMLGVMQVIRKPAEVTGMRRAAAAILIVVVNVGLALAISVVPTSGF